MTEQEIIEEAIYVVANDYYESKSRLGRIALDALLSEEARLYSPEE